MYFTRPLLIFWEKIDETLWKPPAREGCALTILNDKIYMYGGLG